MKTKVDLILNFLLCLLWLEKWHWLGTGYLPTS